MNFALNRYIVAIAVILGYSFHLTFGGSSSSSCELSTFQGMFNSTIGASDYLLEWRVTGTMLEIMVEVSSDDDVNWLAFGLSESGHMLGSDIVTFYNASAGGMVSDMYVPWSPYPLEGLAPELDVYNHWGLTCSDMKYKTKKEKKMTRSMSIRAVMSRILDTLDGQDRAVSPGVIPVIYAWGYDEQGVSYHGSNRGTTEITFIEDPTAAPVSVPTNDFDETLSIMYNPPFVMNGTETQYICQSFDLGETARHGLSIETIFLNSQASENVHHMLVHSCETGAGTYYEMHALSPAPCGAPDSLNAVGGSLLGQAQCSTLVYAWARGGSKLVLPGEAGLRIGDGGIRHIIIETHLTNPSKVFGSIVDHVGVKFQTSKKFRPYDMGSLAIGDPSLGFGSLGEIKKGKDAVHYEATCASQCTEQMTGPLNVFGSFLHMHNFGRQIWTTHISEGAKNKDLTVVDSRQFWNFGFQSIEPVSFIINPGDRLNTHCIYDTSESSEDIYFGLATTAEMCIHFLYYYPAHNSKVHLCGYAGGGNSLCAVSESGSAAIDDKTYISSSITCDKNPDPDGLTEIPSEFEFAMDGFRGNTSGGVEVTRQMEKKNLKSRRIRDAKLMTKMSETNDKIRQAYCYGKQIADIQYIYYYIGGILVLLCCILPCVAWSCLRVLNEMAMATGIIRLPREKNYEMVSLTSGEGGDSNHGSEDDGENGFRDEVEEEGGYDFRKFDLDDFNSATNTPVKKGGDTQSSR